MPEKLDTYPYATSSVEPYEASAPPREAALDRDRRASMADEGGVAAAEVDLNEQLAIARPQQQLVAAWYGRRDWRTGVIWSALAFGVAAVFARALMQSDKRRSRSRSLLRRIIRA